MNPNILKRCVEELKKEAPNIQYVLGMLETVIEMMPNITIGPSASWPAQHETKTTPTRTETVSDEEVETPGFLKTGTIGNIRNN